MLVQMSAQAHKARKTQKDWSLLQTVPKLVVGIVPAVILAFWLVALRSSKARQREQRVGMSRSMLFALGATILLDFLCTDQYQPSMPYMAEDFKVPPVFMGATIQIHLLTCATW